MPRKNVSLPSAIQKRAKEIIKVRGFNGLSDCLQALVREEYERRTPPTVIPSGKAAIDPAKESADQIQAEEQEAAKEKRRKPAAH